MKQIETIIAMIIRIIQLCEPLIVTAVLFFILVVEAVRFFISVLGL